jgi:hypothetical protein
VASKAGKGLVVGALSAAAGVAAVGLAPEIAAVAISYVGVRAAVLAAVSTAARAAAALEELLTTPPAPAPAP